MIHSSFFSLNVQAYLHIMGTKHTQNRPSQRFLTDENKCNFIIQFIMNKIDAPKQLNISL